MLQICMLMIKTIFLLWIPHRHRRISNMLRGKEHFSQYGRKLVGNLSLVPLHSQSPVLLWVNPMSPKIIGIKRPGIHHLSFLKYYLCNILIGFCLSTLSKKIFIHFLGTQLTLHLLKTVFINIQSDQVLHSYDLRQRIPYMITFRKLNLKF